jgi:hypothetical protein
MKKLYLAGRYQTKDILADIAEALRNKGHHVTSSWLNQIDTNMEEAATRDMQDVREADYLVSFTEKSEVGYNTGGRHAEFGAAWVWGKKLLLVGPRENIFHHLPGVVQLNSVVELLEYLDKE